MDGPHSLKLLAAKVTNQVQPDEFKENEHVHHLTSDKVEQHFNKSSDVVAIVNELISKGVVTNAMESVINSSSIYSELVNTDNKKELLVNQ